MRLFFVLSSLFFMSACSSQVYTCHDETGFRGKDFEFDDEKATINRFQSFYYTKKNIKQMIERENLYIKGDWPQADTQDSTWLYEYHEPLKAKIGAYNAKKTDKEIVVRYVLEDILSMDQLPSGELWDTEERRDLYDKLYRSGKYSHWTGFAIQMLMVEKYVFNISKKTVTVFHEYPFPPIRGEKTKWKFENGHLQPKYLGQMSEEELADKRFYPKKTRIDSYPDCDTLNLLELLPYYTMPLWGWMAHLT